MRDEASATWSKFQNEVERGFKKVQAIAQNFGGVIAGVFGVFALKGFVTASNEAEVSSARLGAALKAQGITSDSVKTQMENFSASLQKVTTFSDETITDVQTLLVSMTGLSGKAVQPLTKATLDLATGMKIDVEMAAKLIAKSSEGAEGLKKMGIEIGATSSEAERMAKVIAEVEKRFGGMAEAAGDTAAGKITQFKNAVNDLEERFGEIIKRVLTGVLPVLNKFLDVIQELPTPVLAATLVIGGLTAAIFALNAALLTNPITLAIIGITGATIGLSMAIAESARDMGRATGELKIMREGLIEGTKAAEDFGQAAKGIVFSSDFKMSAKEVKNAVEQFKAMGGVLDEAFTSKPALTLKQMTDQVKVLQQELEGLIPGSDAFVMKNLELIAAQRRLDLSTKVVSGSLGDLQLRLKILQEDLDKLPTGTNAWIKKLNEVVIVSGQVTETQNKVKSALDAAQAPMKAQAEQSKKLGEAYQKAREMHLRFREELEKDIKQPVSGVEVQPVFDLMPEATFNEIQAKLAVLQAQIENMKISDPLLGFKLEMLDALQAKLGSALVTPLQKFKQDFASIARVAKQGFGLIAQVSAQASQSEIDDIETRKETELAAIDEQLKSTTISEEERARLIAQRGELEKKFRAENAAARARQFESEKQQRIIMSIIDTASAVVEALPNIPLAIIVGALGLAQTAIIASQSAPKFHEGGKVPAYHSSSDVKVAHGGLYFDAPRTQEIPILVRGGETIRTEEQERQFQESARQDGQQPVTNNQYTTLTLNINGPIADKAAFKRIVEDGMREIGVTDVSKYFRNQRNVVSVTAS
jgi:hypothetical protein